MCSSDLRISEFRKPELFNIAKALEGHRVDDFHFPRIKLDRTMNDIPNLGGSHIAFFWDGVSSCVARHFFSGSCPRIFVNSQGVVEVSRKHEKGIRESVQILDHQQRNALPALLKSDHLALGTSADRSSKVHMGAKLCSSGKDKTLHRGEMGLPSVDLRLHLYNFLLIHMGAVLARTRKRFLSLACFFRSVFAGEPGSKRKKILLHLEHPLGFFEEAFFFSTVAKDMADCVVVVEDFDIISTPLVEESNLLMVRTFSGSHSTL